MLMKIKEINRFSQRVYNAVLRLLPQLDTGLELPSKKHIKGILKSERTHLFVAELDNKYIVGMLTLATYDIPSGKKFWIEDVVVDKSQRGKGFGRELILFAIEFAKASGATSIELTSRSSRIAANQLYNDSGFVIRETNLYRYTTS
jgi:ribosomal protein S18 acetylase RimI-like enzyme